MIEPDVFLAILLIIQVSGAIIWIGCPFST